MFSALPLLLACPDPGRSRATLHELRGRLRLPKAVSLTGTVARIAWALRERQLPSDGSLARLLRKVLQQLGYDPESRQGQDVDAFIPWLLREMVLWQRYSVAWDRRAQQPPGPDVMIRGLLVLSKELSGEDRQIPITPVYFEPDSRSVQPVLHWWQATNPDLGPLHLHQAIELASDWHCSLQDELRSQDMSPPGKAAYAWADSWTVQLVDDPEHVRAEGVSMQNCLRWGSYDAQVKAGNVEIYSLRQPSPNHPWARGWSKPVVTMAWSPRQKSFLEVKGRQNKIPALKYRARALEFVYEKVGGRMYLLSDVLSMVGADDARLQVFVDEVLGGSVGSEGDEDRKAADAHDLVNVLDSLLRRWHIEGVTSLPAGLRRSLLFRPHLAYLVADIIDRGPADDTRAAACRQPEQALKYAMGIDRHMREDTLLATIHDPPCEKADPSLMVMSRALTYAVSLEVKDPRLEAIFLARPELSLCHKLIIYGMKVPGVATDELREMVARGCRPKDSLTYAKKVDRGPHAVTLQGLLNPMFDSLQEAMLVGAYLGFSVEAPQVQFPGRLTVPQVVEVICQRVRSGRMCGEDLSALAYQTLLAARNLARHGPFFTPAQGLELRQAALAGQYMIATVQLLDQRPRPDAMRCVEENPALLVRYYYSMFTTLWKTMRPDAELVSLSEWAMGIAEQNPKVALELAIAIAGSPGVNFPRPEMHRALIPTLRRYACRVPALAAAFAAEVDRRPMAITKRSALCEPGSALAFATAVERIPNDETRLAVARDARGAKEYMEAIDHFVHPVIWAAIRRDEDPLETYLTDAKRLMNTRIHPGSSSEWPSVYPITAEGLADVRLEMVREIQEATDQVRLMRSTGGQSLDPLLPQDADLVLGFDLRVARWFLDKLDAARAWLVAHELPPEMLFAELWGSARTLSPYRENGCAPIHRRRGSSVLARYSPMGLIVSDDPIELHEPVTQWYISFSRVSIPGWHPAYDYISQQVQAGRMDAGTWEMGMPLSSDAQLDLSLLPEISSEGSGCSVRLEELYK